MARLTIACSYSDAIKFSVIGESSNRLINVAESRTGAEDGKTFEGPTNLLNTYDVVSASL